MELPRQIPYKPTWVFSIGYAAFFGGGSVWLAHSAMHSTLGLRLMGPAGAIAERVFFGFCSAFSAATALMLVSRLSSREVLEFETDALLLPDGFLQRKTLRIAYADIQEVTEKRKQGMTELWITAGGQKHSISSIFLPDKKIFAEVRDFLNSLVRQQSESPAPAR